jgi:AMMECR1 domain-containing protein
MPHDELKLLAVYAMFGIRTINDANLEIAAARQLSASSKSRFGVFVTLRRDENVFNVDNLDEKQIHGCLGHWTPNYSSMRPEELVAHVRQLAHDVRYKDDRRLIFDTDVDEDASAVIEITFMNLPLGEVSDVNAAAFSNKKQGLLVDSGTGKRATYLPGVYPNASWSYISQSVRQKAGLGRNAAARFYAYDTTSIVFQLHSVLFSALSESYLRADVAFFYLNYYTDFVPYEYDRVTRKIETNETEPVRNASCIGDVVVLSRSYRAAFESKPLLSNLDYYYKQWLQDPEAYRQASIFLIRAYSAMGVHASRIQMMSANLYAAMTSKALDPRFELGEAVTVLAQVSVPRMNALAGALEMMRKRAERMLRVEPMMIDNVFEMNWQCQSVRSVFQCQLAQEKSRQSKSKQSKQSKQFKQSSNSHRSAHAEHVAILFSAFMKTVQRKVLWLESLETNYLAVMYEFLTNAEAVMALSEMNDTMSDEIRNQRLLYFSLLSKRRGEYGLYYFKDGRRARLDITGHVINSKI